MAEQMAIPDQLAVVRAKIIALQAEEAALREILLNDPSARVGANYIAAVKELVSYRVRGKELQKANPDLFAKLARETVAQQVWLTPRSED